MTCFQFRRSRARSSSPVWQRDLHSRRKVSVWLSAGAPGSGPLSSPPPSASSSSHALTKFLVKPSLIRRLKRRLLRKMLGRLGALTHQEKLFGVSFITSPSSAGRPRCLRVTACPNAIGLGVVAYLLISGEVEGVLSEKAAWDTVVWFGVIISLAGGLTSLASSSGVATVLTLLARHGLAHRLHHVLGFAYLLHYIFATASRPRGCHMSRSARWLSAAALRLLIRSRSAKYLLNIMWGITEYASGPGRSTSVRVTSSARFLQDQLLRGDFLTSSSSSLRPCLVEAGIASTKKTDRNPN